MKERLPLSVTHPELAEEWSEKNFPFLAEDETAVSVSKVWWHGKCGHEWQARIRNRAGGHGCPFCAGRILLKGFNDMASKHPELVKEWSEKNDYGPDEVTCGSAKRAWWRCKKGHEWNTFISTRTQGNGCPICAKEPVVTGVDDVATLYPEILSEWSEKKHCQSRPGESNIRTSDMVEVSCLRERISGSNSHKNTEYEALMPILFREAEKRGKK